MAIIINMENSTSTKKTSEGKILSGLHLVLSVIVLSAITALLVLLIALLPAIYRTAAGGTLSQNSAATLSPMSTTSAYAANKINAIKPAATNALNETKSVDTAAINARDITTAKAITATNAAVTKTTAAASLATSTDATEAAPIATSTKTSATPYNAAAATITAMAAAAGEYKDEAIVYGLIGENTILFNADLEQITGLPATYFVIITGENEEYYSVTYADLSGYALKTRIVKIDYEPRLKSGTAYFQAQNDTHSVIIREKPTSTSAQLSSLPDGEKAFYYGAVMGEALIPAAGAIWYYVRLGGVYGYVYSVQGSAETFAVNPGDKVVTATPQTDPDPDSEGLPDWAFILLLCIPAVIIMLALFGRSKSANNNQNTKHFDYNQP